jgi:hypothetical protein
MKRIMTTLAIICALSILAGCMSFPIEGDCPKTPDSIYGKETVHGSFYGFNWDDSNRQVRKANNGLGLAKVEYRTNLLYLVISLASMGTYVPVDVDYWVEAPKTIDRLPRKDEGNHK